MSRKRVITVILVTTIAICLVRISRIGHESDPLVPWWWGWPLTLWAHLLNLLRSVLHLGVMALPVAAVVYLIGKGNGLWAGPLRRRRAVLTGALAAVVGLFPASILRGLFSGIMVPFRGPVSGLEAAWSAPIVVLFYGMLGGFLVVALLGALGGAAVYAAMSRSQQSPDRPDGRATAFLIMVILTIFTILIDYGCLIYVESRS